VGTSFAWWLHSLGAERVRVAGRRPPIHPLPGTVAWCPVEELESDDLDLLLIAVSDPALGAVARQLARRPQASVALHVSGHHDAHILTPLARASTAIGSLHPLRAFPTPCRDIDQARGGVFAIDGQPAALDLARGLATALGGRPFEISGTRRLAYHLAASLAAGGVMTVLAAAEELAAAAGLSDDILPAYLDLAQGAMQQARDRAGIERTGIERTGPSTAFAGAITGPMARDDQPVIERQRHALENLAPRLLPLFDTLTSETRRQAARGPASMRTAGSSTTDSSTAESTTPTKPGPDHGVVETE
jgi:predicted short-subunit dehydrogenase-like oxidoreductase (DUF2520 family)